MNNISPCPYVFVLYISALTAPISMITGLAIVPMLIVLTMPIVFIDYKNIIRILHNTYKDAFAILLTILLSISILTIIYNINTFDKSTIYTYIRYIGITLLSYIIYIYYNNHAAALSDKIYVYTTIGTILALSIIGVTGYLLKIFIYLDLPISVDIFKFLLHLDRASTISSLLIWPCILGHINKKKYKIALILYLYAVACLLPCLSLSAKVSIIFSGCVFLFSFLLPTISSWTAGIFITLYLSLCPWLGCNLPEPSAISDWHMPSSLLHRLEIWKYVSTRIFETPFIGHGWGASRIIAKNQTFILVDSFGNTSIQEYLPLHPHNAGLQIWLELGGVGAFLVAAMLIIILVRLKPSRFASRLTWPCNAAALSAAFVVASVSYGFWQEWWQATLWLLAAQMAVQNMCNIRGDYRQMNRGIPKGGGL